MYVCIAYAMYICLHACARLNTLGPSVSTSILPFSLHVSLFFSLPLSPPLNSLVCVSINASVRFHSIKMLLESSADHHKLNFFHSAVSFIRVATEDESNVMHGND